MNRGWVGMGWWVSGLLLGAYKNTTHQHFLRLDISVSAKNFDTLGVFAQGGWCSINILQHLFNSVTYCKQGRKVNTNKCVQHHPSFISLLRHAR